MLMTLHNAEYLRNDATYTENYWTSYIIYYIRPYTGRGRVQYLGLGRVVNCTCTYVLHSPSVPSSPISFVPFPSISFFLFHLSSSLLCLPPLFLFFSLHSFPGALPDPARGLWSALSSSAGLGGARPTDGFCCILS